MFSPLKWQFGGFSVANFWTNPIKVANILCAIRQHAASFGQRVGLQCRIPWRAFRQTCLSFWTSTTPPEQVIALISSKVLRWELWNCDATLPLSFHWKSCLWGSLDFQRTMEDADIGEGFRVVLMTCLLITSFLTLSEQDIHANLHT